MPLILEYLNKKHEHKAKTKIFAYRVMLEESGSIIEDFEDCGEEGAGEKLLHLL